MALTASSLFSKVTSVFSQFTSGGAPSLDVTGLVNAAGGIVGASRKENFVLDEDMPSVAWVRYESTLAGAYPVLDASFVVLADNSPVFDKDRHVVFDRIEYVPLSYRIIPGHKSGAFTIRFTGVPSAVVRPVTDYCEDLQSLCSSCEVQLKGDGEIVVPIANSEEAMLLGHVLNRYRMQTIIKAVKDGREPEFFWYDPRVNKENGGTVNVATASSLKSDVLQLKLDPNVGVNMQVSLTDPTIKNLFDKPNPPKVVTADAYINSYFNKTVDCVCTAPLLGSGNKVVTVGTAVQGWEKLDYPVLNDWFESPPICTRFVYDNSGESKLTPFHYTFAEYVGPEGGTSLPAGFSNLSQALAQSQSLLGGTNVFSTVTSFNPFMKV